MIDEPVVASAEQILDTPAIATLGEDAENAEVKIDPFKVMVAAAKKLAQQRKASPNTLQVKRLTEHATLPVRKSAGAAGYDLYASKATVIPAKGRGAVATDIAMTIPVDHYGKIHPRSGLALKEGIDTGAGVIDSDFTGALGIILYNFGEADFVVKVGDRVAQIIISRCSYPTIEEVSDLSETERGAGGFGSTGMN